VRASNISPATDDYYYSLLLQHFPHRTEEELTDGFETAQDSFLAKKVIQLFPEYLLSLYKLFFNCD
jgi:hypothetical protein